MLKIAVLVSGGGSNLQSILDILNDRYINVQLKWLLASKEGIYGLERAKKHGIKTFVVSRRKNMV